MRRHTLVATTRNEGLVLPEPLETLEDRGFVRHLRCTPDGKAQIVACRQTERRGTA